MAHCLVRDEYAVLTGLGIDPRRVARKLAKASPVTGKALTKASDQTEAFGGKIADAAVLGVSGKRPDRNAEDFDLIKAYFDEVWNQRLFHRARDYVSERMFCQTVRMKRVQGRWPYENEIIDVLARFPDCTLEIRDVVIHENDEIGKRAAVIWLLRGTYSGAPFYGPTNGAPVTVLGASHFEIEHGKLAREYRVFDEIAIMTQIVAHAMTGEALAFGEKGGLDLGLMIDIIEAGPLGSKQLTLKPPIIKARDFDAMPLPVLSSVRQIMATAQAQGGGQRDIYSIIEIFERLGGIEWRVSGARRLICPAGCLC